MHLLSKLTLGNLRVERSLTEIPDKLELSVSVSVRLGKRRKQ